MSMTNIFDYITWRGDLTFEENPLNCVDSLIFSQMAYFPFDELWGPDENGSITIAEAERRLEERMERVGGIRFQMENDKDLFKQMAGSKRFGGLYLKDYVDLFNPEIDMQFAAVTVLLPDSVFLAYRGTDNTFVGWNEDFNMSFSTPVPAQMEAVKYLDKVSGQYPGTLHLGGHSKGGNLAVYASLFCSSDIRERIAGVYNNDGPGFDGTVVPKGTYELISDRLHTFVPQSSVIGLLLDHEEDYTVVHSSQIGILQHDLYSWEVVGPDFVRLKSVTDSSRFIDSTLKNWLTQVTPEQRSRFIEAVFEILDETQAESFGELKGDLLKNSGRILRSVKNMDSETRKMILETASLLIRSAQDSIPEFLPQNLRKDSFDFFSLFGQDKTDESGQ